MELEKNSLSINQIVAQKLDTTVCEGDCIVPDIKPDIFNIITSSGIVNVYKKEIMEGKVRIDGAINTYTIYTSEEDGKRETRSINYVLDFSQIINIENASHDMLFEISTNLKSIEARMVNERKINVKAILDFDVKLFKNNNEEFITGIEDILDLQKKEENITVNSLLGTAKTKAQAKETISIDSIDNLAEILKVNIDITNKDTKVSYNKILAKADTRLKIMYLTDDNRINVVNATIPIMGFLDMENISEENVCDVQYEIKNMVIKPNGMQEHSIYVEIEVEIILSAYETKEINIIKDMYSPSKNLKFEQKKVKVMKNKSNYHDLYSIREKQVVDIINEKIYDADVKLDIENIKTISDGVNINGNVNITFMHSLNNTSDVGISMLNIPIDYKMQCKGINENSIIKIDNCIPLQDFTIMPSGEIDIKIDIEFYITSSSEVDINEICNIQECENSEYNQYNMVIYFTKKDDNLWNIAKEFRSTIEGIKASNNLSSDEITPGMKLFITKVAGVNG